MRRMWTVRGAEQTFGKMLYLCGLERREREEQAGNVRGICAEDVSGGREEQAGMCGRCVRGGEQRILGIVLRKMLRMRCEWGALGIERKSFLQQRD
jgi:hypothetical protein